ncbi:MAG: hypothetical protein GX608_08945 [Lentisphaerae bacterium]|nr:hypothetical protein [Lentisphaerota bacterium]
MKNTACYTCRWLGFAGWFPLINDNVPGETRGRFFGRLRTTWQSALIISTALLGWFFGDYGASRRRSAWHSS